MKILIGAPVRQSEEVFKEYLKSLDNLEKPCQVDRFFYLHNSPDLAKHLKRRISKNSPILYRREMNCVLQFGEGTAL